MALDGSLTAEKTVKMHNTKRPGGKGNSTIAVKNQKQLVFKPITALLDPTVSLKKNATDTMEKAAQNACFSFVISGCSKEVSNNTTIEFYEKHVSFTKTPPRKRWTFANRQQSPTQTFEGSIGQEQYQESSCSSCHFI